ncbi:14023_t:CDS:2, partial [Cetraspora pellucida]
MAKKIKELTTSGKNMLETPAETRKNGQPPLSPQFLPVPDIEKGLKEIIDTSDELIDNFYQKMETVVKKDEEELATIKTREEELTAKKDASERKLANLQARLERRNKASKKITELEKKLEELFNGTNDGAKKTKGQIECSKEVDECKEKVAEITKLLKGLE